jgi:hypothetical protein
VADMMLGTSQPMDLRTKDEAVLRKYLLGDMSPEEQEEIEFWLMSNENAYDLLEAAEDDLIDDSLAGRLTTRDLDRFQNHFLVAPERHRKLQFSRSCRRAVDAAAQRAPVVLPSRPGLLDVLRYRPAFVYAVSALIVILLAGTVWSSLKIVEQQRELRSATAQLADIGRDRDDLKRRLDETQAATRALQAATPPTKLPEAPVLLAMNLVPGITRSSNEIPTLKLTANASAVRFSLALLDDNFTVYRVSLLNADSRQIWTENKVSSTDTRDGKVIVFTVPTQVLSTGDFSFNLLGVPDSGTPESVARYYFRAVRQ